MYEGVVRPVTTPRTYTVQTDCGHETWDDVIGFDMVGGCVQLWGQAPDNRWYLKASYPPGVWRNMWEEL